ncbi:MAG: transglutaminase-like domain-containing protein [Pirellulaceae bacterium]|nr:transglutaminase-like domain-containing protein [Pirellulaceae bacterium]
MKNARNLHSFGKSVAGVCFYGRTFGGQRGVAIGVCLSICLGLVLPTVAFALVQETDPLGRPRQQVPAKKDTPSSVPPGSGTSNSGTEQGRPAGDLPDSPTLKSPAARPSRLRDFVPEKLDVPQLPKSRDFEAEAKGTARLTILQQDNAAPPQPQAENIQTAAANGEIIVAPHGGFRLVKRSSKVWEFGVEISSGNGPLRGAIAAAPVPIEFPEQKITVLSEFKSPNVASVKMKDFAGQGRQMIVNVPNMGPGETARATITMRLDRYDILAPEQPVEWKFAEKGQREGRMFLGESPYIETNHKRYKELGEEIVNSKETPWNQVESIYSWLQKNIQYEFDETIHSSLDALANKKGDCEEFASLFIALCRNRGIPARAVWCNDHTYPEFLMVTPKGEAVWLPCQLTTHDHIFGQMYDDRPILQKGDKFTVVGETQPNRYLKPSMKAAAAVSPQLKWIIQEVDPSEVQGSNSPLGK